MPNIAHIYTVYPHHRRFSQAVSLWPLSTRSLLIKLCQAQLVPITEHSSLSILIDTHPDVIIRVSDTDRLFTFREALSYIEFNPDNPLYAAQYLDICRSIDANPLDIDNAKANGWVKELSLALGEHLGSEVEWKVLFDPDDSWRYHRLHPDLPSNPSMASKIYDSLCRFRSRVEGSVYYSRYTHKNMSRDTRRNVELALGISLDDVPIFGQDDWIRLYHQGIEIEGAVEMRQRWYTSQAKPRTYAAMGGTTYRSSRFLQSFFNELVDAFPFTNHKSRLTPERLILVKSEDEDIHWRIYDLSSFTSNCRVQRGLVESLIFFFEGIFVTVVDERCGPMSVPLSELLAQYYQDCVVEPDVSYERFDSGFEDHLLTHGVASLLGIFGNLMSCTLAHGFIMAQLVDSFDELNIAGDDGIVPEPTVASSAIEKAISIVGDCAMEKTFLGNEEAPIHLKRPFVESFPSPMLLNAIIPPNIATAILLFHPDSDPRYRLFDKDSTTSEKISVVGKDLLRFLRSAYRMKYQDIKGLSDTYRGFRSLVQRLSDIPYIRPSTYSSLGGYLWPVDPLDYGDTFFEFDPLVVLVTLYHDPSARIPKREHILRDEEFSLSSAGSSWVGNSSPRLKLLETLGYLSRTEVFCSREELTSDSIVSHYALDLDPILTPTPIVYEYVVERDIPDHFVYDF